jgi:hypothetical protein
MSRVFPCRVGSREAGTCHRVLWEDSVNDEYVKSKDATNRLMFVALMLFCLLLGLGVTSLVIREDYVSGPAARAYTLNTVQRKRNSGSSQKIHNRLFIVVPYLSLAAQRPPMIAAFYGVSIYAACKWTRE